MQDAAVRVEPGMGRLATRILQSSLGLKYVMAVTGLVLVGFIVSHMVANLLVFADRDALNQYALGLRKLGALLWLARGGILVAAALHVWAAYKLTMRSRAARPVAYSAQATVKATYASRTMRWSGVLVLAFLAYHLAHYALFAIHPEYEQFQYEGHHDVYRMVVTGFSDPVLVGVYVVAQVLLGLHLSHGFASVFQSTGLTNDQYKPMLQKLGMALGWAITAGFISVPMGVLAGVIRL